jgi:hypothetical protein|tara:strand:+ start:416 stop:724 length:309 start_codon:yes stop_codon:yes gene_type:complete
MLEWKLIGKGAEICTNLNSGMENEDLEICFYEDFVPLTDPPTQEPLGLVTEVYKKEDEEYSYIMSQQIDYSYYFKKEPIPPSWDWFTKPLIDQVLIRFNYHT